MTDTRELAVETLQNILNGRTFFNEIKSGEELSSHKDFAFINMLVLTALRRLTFLQKTISVFASKKLPDKQAFARYALILAATEILFLETPDYAVLNSYVNLVKKQNDKYVAGFVNAVLRKIAGAKNELLAADNGIFFPPAFRKLLASDYNEKTIALIEAEAQSEPPLDLSTKSDASAWAEKLGGTLLPNGTIRLENGGKIPHLAGYKEGTWWVQDFAASLAAQTFSQTKDKEILDLCAAPGGKTAQLLSQGAKVTSLDISAERLQTMQENLKRLQLPLPQTICDDALAYLETTDQEFDAVLLDAPCSATGTLRRHPEIIHLKGAADIEKMAKLQKQILNKVGKVLKTGGELVYCTCSIAKAEGEKQIAAFLANHKEFRLVPITEKDIRHFEGASFAEIFTPEGYIRTLPHHLLSLGGADSFFIAKLQKVS